MKRRRVTTTDRTQRRSISNVFYRSPHGRRRRARRESAVGARCDVRACDASDASDARTHDKTRGRHECRLMSSHPGDGAEGKAGRGRGWVCGVVRARVVDDDG